jgi:hypothetical protein
MRKEPMPPLVRSRFADLQVQVIAVEEIEAHRTTGRNDRGPSNDRR